MKKVLFGCVLVLAAASVASAAIGDVSPVGLTGLWRFQAEDPVTGRATMAATVGTDMVSSHVDNSENFLGPWTEINPGMSDGGCAQERSWDFLTVYHGMSANGGGSYVNQYTVAIDYCQTSGLTGWNSLFQTSWNGNANDGDLWTDGAGHIGVGATGYSTLTYDASKWHRIVWTIDNSSFFRVYVDGVLFLDAAGQGVDGRFSLELDRFHLFADDSWEDAWGMVGTVATWGRALSGTEVADMGGWIGDATMPTPLTLVPEPATLAMLTIGGIFALRRNRK